MPTVPDRAIWSNTPLWRDKLGSVAASSEPVGQLVPEPGGCVLIGAVMTAWLFIRRPYRYAHRGDVIENGAAPYAVVTLSTVKLRSAFPSAGVRLQVSDTFNTCEKWRGRHGGGRESLVAGRSGAIDLLQSGGGRNDGGCIARPLKAIFQGRSGAISRTRPLQVGRPARMLSWSIRLQVATPRTRCRGRPGTAVAQPIGTCFSIRRSVAMADDWTPVERRG